jgi:hypothetical protein
LVGLTVDRRNLPLTESVAQGIDHGLHGNTQPAGHFAVDLNIHAKAVVLRFRGDVAQHLGLLQLLG